MAAAQAKVGSVDGDDAVDVAGDVTNETTDETTGGNDDERQQGDADDGDDGGLEVCCTHFTGITRAPFQSNDGVDDGGGGIAPGIDPILMIGLTICKDKIQERG